MSPVYTVPGVRRPKVYWPYTIADIGSAKWVDFSRFFGGVTLNYSIDVTTLLTGLTGVFADFMTALLGAMATASGDSTWHWSTRAAGDNIQLSSNSAAVFTLLNVSGAHAANNFLATHFGLPHLEIAINNAGVDTDLGGVGFPSCVFVSPVAVRYDSQDEFAVDDDGVTKSISGLMKYIHEAEVPVRMAKWAYVPPENMRKAKATFPLRTLEGLWRDGRAAFEYWNDQANTMGSGSSTVATYPSASLTTEQHGKYSLDHDTVLNGFHPIRLGNKELYSWDMGMVRMS